MWTVSLFTNFFRDCFVLKFSFITSRSSDGHIYGSYASIFELRKWIKKIMDYKGEHKDFVDDNTDVLYNKDFH